MATAFVAASASSAGVGAFVAQERRWLREVEDRSGRTVEVGGGAPEG